MRLNILPSPNDDVVLTPYEASAFPKFSPLFQSPSSSSPLHSLALNFKDETTAVVLENRSRKAITALCYRWIVFDASGKQRSQTVSSDSYMVDVYRPVVGSGTRLLITRSASVDETVLDHILAGGGCVGASSVIEESGSRTQISELTFAVDFLLFEDGQIAGADPDHYGLVLQCRKRGAEFVAKQIRLAEADGRDATPVLSALNDIPHFGSLHRSQGDRLVQWTQYYADYYLRHMRPTGSTEFNSRDAVLRHLESRPDIPKLYRSEQ